MERVLKRDELEYSNLLIVCNLLNNLRGEENKYTIEEVYYDYRAKLVWTTIVAYKKKNVKDEYQLLGPVEWEMITSAKEPADYYKLVEWVINKRII